MSLKECLMRVQQRFRASLRDGQDRVSGDPSHVFSLLLHMAQQHAPQLCSLCDLPKQGSETRFGV